MTRLDRFMVALWATSLISVVISVFGVVVSGLRFGLSKNSSLTPIWVWVLALILSLVLCKFGMWWQTNREGGSHNGRLRQTGTK